MTAVFYIEGGGDNRRLGTQFREAWARLSLQRAGLGESNAESGAGRHASTDV